MGREQRQTEARGLYASRGTTHTPAPGEWTAAACWMPCYPRAEGWDVRGRSGCCADDCPRGLHVRQVFTLRLVGDRPDGRARRRAVAAAELKLRERQPVPPLRR